MGIFELCFYVTFTAGMEDADFKTHFKVTLLDTYYLFIFPSNLYTHRYEICKNGLNKLFVIQALHLIGNMLLQARVLNVPKMPVAMLIKDVKAEQASVACQTYPLYTALTNTLMKTSTSRPSSCTATGTCSSLSKTRSSSNTSDVLSELFFDTGSTCCSLLGCPGPNMEEPD